MPASWMRFTLEDLPPRSCRRGSLFDRTGCMRDSRGSDLPESATSRARVRAVRVGDETTAHAVTFDDAAAPAPAVRESGKNSRDRRRMVAERGESRRGLAAA